MRPTALGGAHGIITDQKRMHAGYFEVCMIGLCHLEETSVKFDSGGIIGKSQAVTMRYSQSCR